MRRRLDTTVSFLRSTAVLAVILASVVALGACSDADTPIVVTAAGLAIEGNPSPTPGVAEFLGIPYARPPVGQRRWAPAEAPWTDRSRVSARRFAPACIQGTRIVDWYRDLINDFGGKPDIFPVPEFSEDCLYLNVWAPMVGEQSDRPVMVWIHGGSLKGGWSYEPNYVGHKLAARGVIVVSIAYRLDVFGFFSHPELENSNFGLLDQLAALDWVQENIAAFGGDPRNVTVFGESAGAASIGYILASSVDKLPFRRAIIQSGAYQLLRSDYRSDFLDKGLRLQELAVGKDSAGLATMRTVSAETILDATDAVFGDYWPGAVVDGSILPSPPGDALVDKSMKAVDIIIGTNAHEFRMYIDPESTASDVEAWLDTHARGVKSEVLELVTDQLAPVDMLDRLETARSYSCPSLKLASAIRASGRNAYVYRFSREREGEYGARIGAYHGAEIPYVFGTHDKWLPTGTVDDRLGEEIATRWTTFARNGEPSVSNGPSWPVFEIDNMLTLDLGEGTRVLGHPDRRLCMLLGQANGDKVDE